VRGLRIHAPGPHLWLLAHPRHRAGKVRAGWRLRRVRGARSVPAARAAPAPIAITFPSTSAAASTSAADAADTAPEAGAEDVTARRLLSPCPAVGVVHERVLRGAAAIPAQLAAGAGGRGCCSCCECGCECGCSCCGSCCGFCCGSCCGFCDGSCSPPQSLPAAAASRLLPAGAAPVPPAGRVPQRRLPRPRLVAPLRGALCVLGTRRRGRRRLRPRRRPLQRQRRHKHRRRHRPAPLRPTLRDLRRVRRVGVPRLAQLVRDAPRGGDPRQAVAGRVGRGLLRKGGVVARPRRRATQGGGQRRGRHRLAEGVECAVERPLCRSLPHRDRRPGRSDDDVGPERGPVPQQVCCGGGLRRHRARAPRRAPKVRAAPHAHRPHEPKPDRKVLGQEGGRRLVTLHAARDARGSRRARCLSSSHLRPSACGQLRWRLRLRRRAAEKGCGGGSAHDGGPERRDPVPARVRGADLVHRLPVLRRQRHTSKRLPVLPL